VTSPLVAAVALTMAATPLLLVLNERVLQPRVGTKTVPGREPDAIEEHNQVLIAGFGGFGTTVGRLLRAKGVGATVLEADSDRVELLRRLGLKVYYGDATRHDLLEAGVQHVYRQSLDTPLRMGAEALGLLGFRAYHAERAAQAFLRHDEVSLRQLTESRHAERSVYLSAARRRIEDLERMLLADLEAADLDRDAGWDPESLREELRRS
jgi:hypothetical protein